LYRGLEIDPLIKPKIGASWADVEEKKSLSGLALLANL